MFFSALFFRKYTKSLCIQFVFFVALSLFQPIPGIFFHPRKFVCGVAGLSVEIVAVSFCEIISGMCDRLDIF